MSLKALLLIVALLLAAPLNAQAKRALLIGINDYTMSKAGWPNLTGTVNDVTTLREMLLHVYGFKAENIVTLTDRQATRAAILQKLDELTNKSAKNDVILFYFAGHGSQVLNSRSDEPDRMDETIVPADSRVDARDIRDKELRPRFNRILGRGAKLTVILDACHSGSGARTGAQARGVKPDVRDLADANDYGPKPETRGALVLAASQDFDEAYETEDDRKTKRGVFSWALITALRDAEPGEPAEETFLRARARVYVDRPFQQPVLAGNEAARRAPFLGVRVDRKDGKALVAVSKVGKDTALLQGGWANGLAAGTKLKSADGARLTVTGVTGMVRSDARIDAGRVTPGTLLEVTRWTAPPGRKLRVWTTRPVTEDVEVVAQKADADYLLSREGKRFAWVRQSATADDAKRSGLPVRTKWTTNPEESLRALRKIHGWLTLQSPAGPRYPYSLAIRSRQGKDAVMVRNKETYTLHLKARFRPQRVQQRYIYVFTIDSSGRSVLLFPQPGTGSVENRFPLAPDVIPDEIALSTTVRIEPPLGVDTWFLLTTEEPIPNPAILQWDGARAGRANWSIERFMVESVTGN
jgi:uncharacterized caspase-like protein